MYCTIWAQERIAHIARANEAATARTKRLPVVAQFGQVKLGDLTQPHIAWGNGSAIRREKLDPQPVQETGPAIHSRRVAQAKNNRSDVWLSRKLVQQLADRTAGKVSRLPSCFGNEMESGDRCHFRIGCTGFRLEEANRHTLSNQRPDIGLAAAQTGLKTPQNSKKAASAITEGQKFYRQAGTGTTQSIRYRLRGSNG